MCYTFGKKFACFSVVGVGFKPAPTQRLRPSHNKGGMMSTNGFIIALTYSLLTCLNSNHLFRVSAPPDFSSENTLRSPIYRVLCSLFSSPFMPRRGMPVSSVAAGFSLRSDAIHSPDPFFAHHFYNTEGEGDIWKNPEKKGGKTK